MGSTDHGPGTVLKDPQASVHIMWSGTYRSSGHWSGHRRPRRLPEEPLGSIPAPLNSGSVPMPLSACRKAVLVEGCRLQQHVSSKPRQGWACCQQLWLPSARVSARQVWMLVSDQDNPGLRLVLAICGGNFVSVPFWWGAVGHRLPGQDPSHRDQPVAHLLLGQPSSCGLDGLRPQDLRDFPGHGFVHSRPVLVVQVAAHLLCRRIRRQLGLGIRGARRHEQVQVLHVELHNHGLFLR